jgi:hypothetical protein
MPCREFGKEGRAPAAGVAVAGAITSRVPTQASRALTTAAN